MGSSPLLLIAEDDPDDQWLIQDAIEGACLPAVETHFVGDGVELIDYLQQKDQPQTKPSLVMLDLNMPRKDGRVALREIKADPDLADIPIVILTTSQREEDIRYCQSYGVDEYYRKPSTIADLASIIERICSEYLSSASN